MLISSHTPTDQQWPEILGILSTMSVAADSGKRETAFRVFANSPGVIQKQHEDAVLQAFNRGFKDDSVAVSSALRYFAVSG